MDGNMNLVILKHEGSGSIVISKVPDKLTPIKAGTIVRVCSITNEKTFLGICLCDSFKATEEIYNIAREALRIKGNPKAESKVNTVYVPFKSLKVEVVE